jgi:hypothetical protein
MDNLMLQSSVDCLDEVVSFKPLIPQMKIVFNI